MKTHSGAKKKRFKKTAKGKLRGRRALLEPHPREEVPRPQAPARAALGDLPRGQQAGVNELLAKGGSLMAARH